MSQVLVIEDYDDTRLLVECILQDAGYRVLSAASATEGVWLARTQRPDAILMDVFMPGVDGLEATRQLKADPATAAVPVIAYTARPLAAAAAAHLFAAVCEKPCRPDELLRVIRRVLPAPPA